jgi:hypothetical protein
MHDAANGNPAATKLLMHVFAAIILVEDVRQNVSRKRQLNNKNNYIVYIIILLFY